MERTTTNFALSRQWCKTRRDNFKVISYQVFMFTAAKLKRKQLSISTVWKSEAIKYYNSRVGYSKCVNHSRCKWHKGCLSWFNLKFRYLHLIPLLDLYKFSNTLTGQIKATCTILSACTNLFWMICSYLGSRLLLQCQNPGCC